jgi:hypothetical protein
VEDGRMNKVTTFSKRTAKVILILLSAMVLLPAIVVMNIIALFERR